MHLNPVRLAVDRLGRGGRRRSRFAGGQLGCRLRLRLRRSLGLARGLALGRGRSWFGLRCRWRILECDGGHQPVQSDGQVEEQHQSLNATA